MDSNKRRKRTKLCVCSKCNKSFYTYSYSSQQYCSKSCYYDYIRDLRTICKCETCGNDIKSTKYRCARNSNYYCSRECYNNRRKDSLKRLKRTTKYYQQILSNATCECGENKYYLLQIHHKDGNHKNNNIDNLEIVCSNCHIKRHLKIDASGKYIYSPKDLTNRDLLKNL